MKTIIAKKFPFLFKWYQLIKLGILERKVIPNYINLTFSGNPLYANPFENRGLSLLRNKGSGQPFIKKFWRIGVELFQPELALDVGANYGEVLLDTNYPSTVKKVIGVEANPFIYKYLIKSKAQHIAKDKLLIINGLASEENVENVTFYIDEDSSGRSTALKNNFVKKSKEVSVSAYRLDDLVKSYVLNPTAILFKIDVEGFEPFVLKGMSGLFDSTTNIVGCIEFNLTSLNRNNIDVQQYLKEINDKFHTLILKKEGKIIAVDQLTIENLKQNLTNKNTEGDILLFSNIEQLRTFQKKYIS